MAVFAYLSLYSFTTPLQSPLSFSTQVQAVSNNATSSPAHNLRVVFITGGTGGHIYPAIAIADHLKILNPNDQFLFVGTPTGMEVKAIPSAGFPFTTVPSAPLARPFLSPRNLFVLSFILTSSIFKNLKILHEFDPNIVICTGGFVSFPTCVAGD